MKKGTFVMRSTYQKVCEENKKLLNDIHILVQERSYNEPPPVEKLLVIEKWRKKFKADRDLTLLIQEVCRKTSFPEAPKQRVIREGAEPQKPKS